MKVGGAAPVRVPEARPLGCVKEEAQLGPERREKEVRAAKGSAIARAAAGSTGSRGGGDSREATARPSREVGVQS